MLRPDDDLLRDPGPEPSWNESRYVDFYNPAARVGGWLRTGNRVNAGHAELSVGLYLPDGSAAVRFDRVSITDNSETVADLRWEVVEPFMEARVRFAGTLALLRDPQALVDPKRAFADAPRLECAIALTIRGEGLALVYGRDQDQIARIFLPGQADGHYQQLVRTTGEVRPGATAPSRAPPGCAARRD